MVPGFARFPFYFLVSLIFVAPWIAAFIAFVTLIYMILAFTNLFMLHGKEVAKHLQAPDRIALSKLSLKVSWNGRFFAQYGAMLAWHEIAALDFLPATDDLDTAKVAFKYKMPDGFAILPFALSSFSSQEEAAMFMEMANKYVKDEVKSAAFLEAYAQREAITKQSRVNPVDELLSLPPANPVPPEKQIETKAEAQAVLESLAKAQSECTTSTVYVGEKVKEKIRK
jgi:hypothetical protein